MMDQADCVYFKCASMASNNREENGTFALKFPLIHWIRNLSKNHARWLKMKFCFSSMLTTS